MVCGKEEWGMSDLLVSVGVANEAQILRRVELGISNIFFPRACSIIGRRPDIPKVLILNAVFEVLRCQCVCRWHLLSSACNIEEIDSKRCGLEAFVAFTVFAVCHIAARPKAFLKSTNIAASPTIMRNSHAIGSRCIQNASSAKAD